MSVRYSQHLGTMRYILMAVKWEGLILDLPILLDIKVKY